MEPTSARADAYRFVQRQLAEGRQAYVVYPLVEESEKLNLKAAVEMAVQLETEVFPDYRVALVHGRMKAGEREETMRRFTEHDVDLLVATTVVEVGVDVPNASVMLVEHAERFGWHSCISSEGAWGAACIGHTASCCIRTHCPRRRGPGWMLSLQRPMDSNSRNETSSYADQETSLARDSRESPLSGSAICCATTGSWSWPDARRWTG